MVERRHTHPVYTLRYTHPVYTLRYTHPVYPGLHLPVYPGLHLPVYPGYSCQKCKRCEARVRGRGAHSSTIGWPEERTTLRQGGFNRGFDGV